MCPKLVEFLLENPFDLDLDPDPEQVTVSNRFLDELTKHGTLKIIKLCHIVFRENSLRGDFGELIARCHDLEELTVEQMTEDNLIAIAQNCPKLVSLILQVNAFKKKTLIRPLLNTWT